MVNTRSQPKISEEDVTKRIEEPKFEKWTELSPKLKSECMKHLDFKTRWNLRSTSKTEKSLADSQKFKINKVSIDYNGKMLKITQNKVVFTKKYDDKNQLVALSEYILHHGILDILEFKGYANFLKSPCQFSVKNLEFYDVSKSGIEFWIGKTIDKLKSVKLNKADIYELVSISKMKDIHSLTIKEGSQREPEKISEFWIRNDAEIGQKFQILSAEKGSFKKFSKFSGRIMSESKNFKRIRTDNPEKYILLEAVPKQGKNVNKREHLRMTVIPASFGDDYSNLFKEEKEEKNIEKPEDLIVEAYHLEKWNEVPDLVKRKFLKHLDIKTRMKLRLTSKTEKALVDSEKFNIESAEISFFYKTIEIKHHEPLSCHFFSDVNDLVKSSEYILEHGIFEKLEIWFERYKLPTEHFHRRTSCQYSAKNLKVILWIEQYEENFGIFLNRMSNDLENLEIDIRESKPSRIHNMFDSPNIPNISFIRVASLLNTSGADKLAQVWIQKDAKIGNKYQVLMLDHGSFYRFSQVFKDRVVFQSNEFVCIKTDNASKNILLQVGRSNVGDFKGIEEFLQMTVISADTKEYDKDEEWVRTWAEEFDVEGEDSDSDDGFNLFGSHRPR